MRCLALLTLLAAVPSQAQTCSGVLNLTFVDPTTTARPRPEVHIQEVDVRAQFLTARIPAGTTPAASAVSAAQSRTAHLPAYGDAYVNGTVLSLAPECGTSLLHLTLVYHHQTMTLDLYHVPSHVPLAFDAPLPFRAGRFVFDFDAAERVGSRNGLRVYPAGAVRRGE